MITQEENLKNIIEDIQNNEIMLPDFQRRFEWSIEKQCGLVASVLTMLPVGGILLLKADSSDYKSKRIGLLSELGTSGTIPNKTNFLLDGQQRMTCLTNVFSDIIHEASGKKVSNLAPKNLLATRFYLRIDKWDANMSSASDIYGIRSLDFKFDVSKGEEPDFLTADIIDNVICRQFNGSEYGLSPYMPGSDYGVGLDDYCFSEVGSYLIPLFLLVGSNARDDKKRRKRLNDIIDRMKDNIVSAITTYHCNLVSGEQKDFAFSVLIDPADQMEYESAVDRDSKFQELVESKADLWQDYFQNYLYGCVEKLKLNKIEMPEGSRARAIDIYENMNMGGLALSTLDLVAARVAKVSQESLYDRIIKNLTSNKKYNNSAIPDDVKTYLPMDYNASLSIKAVENNKSTKGCTDLFLELLGLYINNRNYEVSKVKAIYSKSTEILRLSENDINIYCEKVCLALDRAFCFLQVRCGVQSLTDINYKIMVRVIAYIFTNDKWYKSEVVHKKLEAWYWSAIFSGEYDKDQSDRYENNLRSLLDSLQAKKPMYDWIIHMKENVLSTPYFSDCDFLLMEKKNEGRLPKDHLGKYFCQFYLSRPYSDLITDTRVVSVFADRKLEKHHIIPLGSVSSIGESTEKLRSDKTHIANSPLNFVFITDSTNLEISAKSLKEYESAITPQAKHALNIMNYPSVSDLSDDMKVKQWLGERHKLIKGQIQNRVDSLLR